MVGAADVGRDVDADSDVGGLAAASSGTAPSFGADSVELDS